MAIFFDAPVSPDALTAFMREIPTPSALTLLGSFPTQTVRDNKVNWAEITRTNRTARFRPFDAPVHVSRRDAAETAEVKLLPLGTSLTLGEYERLQMEFARTGGTNTSALVDAIYNDAERLVAEVQYRLEQAWGDVVTDGKLTLSEGGLIQEADFAVPTAHKPTATTAWTSTSTALALNDLIAWTDVYIATNGTPPETIRLSRRILRLLLSNAQIITACYGSAAGRSWATIPDVNSVLAANGIPPLSDPYDTLVDVDGTSTRVIPEDRLMLTPASLGEIGALYVGVSATALELVGAPESSMSFSAAPGIVGVVHKDGPPFRQQTLVDGVAMPVLTQPKRLFVAKVF